MVDYFPFEKTFVPYSIFSTSNEIVSSHEAAHLAEQSTTMSGMTQEMEALAFEGGEGGEGVELTDEEADAGAREYDAAQVPAN